MSTEVNIADLLSQEEILRWADRSDPVVRRLCVIAETRGELVKTCAAEMFSLRRELDAMRAQAEYLQARLIDEGRRYAQG